MKLRILFILCLVHLGICAQNYHVVKTLKNFLFIYDSTYKAFVPLLDLSSPVSTFSYVLHPHQFKDQYLYFKANDGVSVYINNQLVQKFVTTTNRYMNINKLDSLVVDKSLIITFNVPITKSRMLIESLKIVGKNTSINYSDSSISPFEDHRLAKLEYNSIILICLIVFFIFYAIQRNVSKRLYDSIYNIRYMVTDIKVEDLITISNIDRYKFLLLVFNSIIIGFIIFVFTQPYQYEYLNNQGVIFNILKVSLSVFIFFILKYSYVILVSTIFKISKWINIQYFEFIKLTMNFGLYLLFIYLLFYSPFTIFNITNFDIISISTIILIIVFILRVAFTVKKITGFRNFYLISYLCIAEIVPITLFYTIYFR